MSPEGNSPQTATARRRSGRMRMGMPIIGGVAPVTTRLGIWGAVVLPRGAGYLLSYFFRNVMGPVSSDLMRDTGVDAVRLGLLTGLYFAAFTISQIPLGLALDRFGPRRVQSVLLLLAAFGAMLFSLAQGLVLLGLGRLLIGLGTAGCLTAGLKATMQWSDRRSSLSSINGVFIMFGGIGAMAATSPLAILADRLGWRWTFGGLALASAALALGTWLLVPEPSGSTGRQGGGGALRGHPANISLWLLAPMSALTFGVVSAFQGLWASRWLVDVDHLSQQAVVHRLLVMAAAMAVGAPLLGVVAGALRRLVRMATLTTVVAGVLVAVEAVICLPLPVPGVVAWPAMALFAAIPVLSYGVVADLYPATLIGRANAVLNMAHTGVAFLAQFGVGAVISLWPSVGGAYPAQAYRCALAVAMMVQLSAVAVFALHLGRRRQGGRM